MVEYISINYILMKYIKKMTIHTHRRYKCDNSKKSLIILSYYKIDNKRSVYNV